MGKMFLVSDFAKIVRKSQKKIIGASLYNDQKKSQFSDMSPTIVIRHKFVVCEKNTFPQQMNFPVKIALSLNVPAGPRVCPHQINFIGNS